MQTESPKTTLPMKALTYHVSGKIERGESEPIAGIPVKYAVFPSGARFAPSKKLLVNSLFNPKGTDSGFYTIKAGGIMFHRGNGEPWFFLVANRYTERFFVSCGKRSDGRTIYSFALSKRESEPLGMGHDYIADTLLAESMFRELTA